MNFFGLQTGLKNLITGLSGLSGAVTMDTIGGWLLNNGVPLVLRGTLASGDNDLYTVPAGQRLLIFASKLFNTNAASRNFYPTVKSGGTVYQLQAATSLATVTGTTTTSMASPLFVYEPGDIVGCNVSGSDVNYSLFCLLFDTSSPLRSPRVLAISTSDTTLYTVPTGKVASFVANTPLVPGNIGAGICRAYTTLGATFTLYQIPNGGSKAATNQYGVIAAAANVRADMAAGGGMQAGDYICVNTSALGPTHTLWTTILELPV